MGWKREGVATAEGAAGVAAGHHGSEKGGKFLKKRAWWQSEECGCLVI